MQQFLLPQKPRVGRPNHDHRRIIKDIRWILTTGAPWRDLPECSGPWQTVASRFDRWQKTGVWDRTLAALQQQADGQGKLHWTIHCVDGPMIRAHQHAAGARRGGAAEQALGKSQGGGSPSVHLRADSNGKPLTILLTPGQRHERTQGAALLDQEPVKRQGCGRPTLRPRRIVGDKGSRRRANREAARRRRVRATIRHKANERCGRFDRAADRQRNRIERLVNRGKHWRRLAIRDEKCGENGRAMWVIAAISLWL